MWIYLDLPIENGDFPYKSPFSHGFSSFTKTKRLVIWPSLAVWDFRQMGHPQLTFQGAGA